MVSANEFKSLHVKQECIPVGCVPADRRPYGGVCFPGGEGVSMPGGLVSAAGGVSRLGGVCSGGGVVSMVVVSGPGGSPCQTPPVNRMTDRCKNITLAKTSFRPVISLILAHPSLCCKYASSSLSRRLLITDRL